VRFRVLAVAAVLALTGCGSAQASGPLPPHPSPPSSDQAHVEIHKLPRLPSDGRFDYQIGGAYEPPPDVAVVDRDRHDEPVPGRFNVCYVNAFQTQPDEADFWTREHPDLLARKSGTPVTDPDWPGEYLLDTSTAAHRDALMRVVGAWVDGCAANGFQAVEPDNLDSWTRSKGVLTRKGNLAFAGLVALRGHVDGLLVAQKNTAELGARGRTTAHFDFAVAEECQVYGECDAYTEVYGDQVVEIEYTDNPRAPYAAACRARGSTISVVLRDRDVVPQGRPGYVDEEC
jgi:Glycoside-hydrolase family GH114